MITKTCLALGLVLAPLLTVSAIAADAPSATTNLPKVLIIGDSISLGYTPVVQKLLEGVADVSHPTENCAYTGFGLEHIHSWLGTQHWGVIHFNFGIWDTHLLREGGALVSDESPQSIVGTHIRYKPEEYRKNLTKIVEILEKTGAKLIWASTTPVTSRTGKRLQDIPKDNEVAAEIMKAHKIPTDDLFTFVSPSAKAWQNTDGCHFGVAGNEQLAKHVAESIQQTLKSPKAK